MKFQMISSKEKEKEKSTVFELEQDGRYKTDNGLTILKKKNLEVVYDRNTCLWINQGKITKVKNNVIEVNRNCPVFQSDYVQNIIIEFLEENFEENQIKKIQL